MNAGFVYRDRVRPEDAGKNVLAYHVERFPHSESPDSASIDWRDSIDAGRVRVNGKAADVEMLLRTGDALEFHRPPWEEPRVPLSFRVVHEDDAVLVVEKPAGLQVLPAGAFLQNTLWFQVRASDPSRARSAPVHRLGRGTSGLVLFGRTQAARASLSAQLRDRTPCKTYLALARGVELPGSCAARHPIGPVEHGPLTIWAATKEGKPSHTRVRVIERDRRAGRSLVAAQPITGRPDQIRIHLAALGAPLVGDPLFGPGGVVANDVPPGAGGYFLHAAGLRFVHPTTGTTVKVRSRPSWS